MAAHTPLERKLLTALELIEVDLTAGEMPAKTRIALALDRIRAAITAATSTNES